jgi:outer membrane protein assembly factor BamE (lipoprotein component of BamABCDE complex)
MMKKISLIAIVLIAVTVVVSSCTSSRKATCPMAEGIIH